MRAFFSMFLFILRDSTGAGGGPESAVSTEPDAGLEPMNCEMVT